MKGFILVTILVLLRCTLGQQDFFNSRIERSALLDLRSSLGIRSTDWPVKSNPCKKWTGIQCRNGRVAGINISGFKRTRAGRLNPSFSVGSLANLTFLESFNASGFSLPGSIPDWFGYRLGSLKVLDLRSSSVTGPIPASLGNLTGLNALYLANNDLAGSMPAALGQLMQLLVLDLSRNSLTGLIPNDFGLLRNLSCLDLSSNHFSGSIPSTFGSISGLQFLNVSDNGLVGSVPVELGNLSHLVKLNLGMNVLSGSLPVEFMRLRNLEMLVLRHNRLEGRLPDGLFSSLGKLRVLELRENKFDGALPGALWSLRNLQVLDVSANNFTGDLSNFSFKGHASGAVFNLSNNQLYGTTACLSGNYTSIDLSGNYFQGKVPRISPSNGSLGMNCLQAVPDQRRLEDCSLFYAGRGLTFDYFGNPEPRQQMLPTPAPRRRKRWIYILVVLLGGVGFIAFFVLVIVSVLRKCNNAISNERGSADVGPVPEGDSPPIPKDPTSVSSLGESFTYEQLRSLTGEFSEINLIRHGHSGDLYQGFLEGGIPIVVKRINLHSLKKDSYVTELEFFTKYSHARLIPLLGHCLENENQKLLVYKYMPNGDLAESLFRVTNFEDNGLQSLDWITRLKIAIGAAEGLSYLHHECNPPLVHRDVQASSILLDDKFEVRLGSLSEIHIQEGDSHQSVLTRFLRKSQSSISDPGTSGSSPITCAHDVYCFGKVLLELVTGKLGISKSDDATTKEWLEQTLVQISIYDKELVAKIVDPSLIIDEDLLEEVWAMTVVARSCLNPKPSKRPPMKYVLKALENPLKVVREDSYSSERLRTTSSRRSWSAAFFGSWRHSSDNVTVLGHANREGISGLKQPGRVGAICGSLWKNTEGQLSFLKHAVLAPPEVFTFAHSGRQLNYMDAVHGHKFQVGHANHAWLCLDLLDVLCQLAETGHASSVRSILEYPLKHCPELLLLGMFNINTAYSLLQYEVSFRVFPLILKSPACVGMMLYLWHLNPNLVLRGFVEAGNVESNIMTKILDVCQELKILPSVLDMIPFTSGIRLAALASRKELIDLEKWLSNNLITYKDSFFEECLRFLKEIQLGGSQDFSAKPFHHQNNIANHYSETSSSFLKVLQAHTSLIISTQLSEEMERLHVTVMDSNPRLQNGSSAESSTPDGFSDDVEAEANSYFHQMFSGQLTIDAMVQMLARFKESSVKREQLIFECMIGNLFEEYRFFPKYPERQLKIAALLFGSVIKHQLVTHLTLGIALRGVLDALRKPPDSKMFVFGTKSLEQFVDRLIEWPQYCNHILQISHLRGTHTELVAFIERALARISSGHLESDGTNNASAAHHHGLLQAASVNGESNSINIPQLGQQLSSTLHSQQRHESSLDDRLKASAAPFNDTKPFLSSGGQSSAASSDASSIQKNTVTSSSLLSSSPGFVRPSRAVTSTRFGSALNIETLVAAAERRETQIEAPGSEIQDKISFIINNISVANVEAKAKEFTEILKEQHYPWFAQYMVMKRASIEPNFHDLYLKFLDKVYSKALSKEIVQASYENCKVLLGSELIKSSSEERSLLKNLGSWLGKLTIGRNQVLRAREIDPKSLIIEAYEKGLMIAVIPFTSKVLEPCQSSLAYQPPNPWTMGILGLLAEIYSMPNLKMNLKFDIEVLFKNLGVDMKDIAPTSLLKDRKREIEGNPDFSNKDVGASQPQLVPEVKSGIISPLNHVELPLEVASPPNSGGHGHLLSQYASPVHALMEDDKLAALGLSDQLPSAQGLFQATPSQSTFSASQLPTAIPNIGTHVIINQKLNSWGLNVHFQRLVPAVMDRAIKDIVSGIVQRSVSIATQTTKELVLKDYAMESDETRIYNAAHLMVASLAGSLAHVTCKEPLRGSISSQLRNSVQSFSLTSEILEHAVQLVTNDNLDLGCAVIEQAATDKAIQTIDTEIAQQLVRRKHRDGVGQTFFDANMYTQSSMGVVPDALRPKPGHLSVSQQRVYEDFVRLPWQNQSSHSSPVIPAGSASSGLASAYGSVSSDVASEAIESNSAALLSASSIHSAAADGVIPQSSENNSISSSFSATAASSELHPVESSDVKESGVSSEPSSAASERAGSSVADASLSTRDALDKYQIIAQKLETLVASDSREAEIQGVVTEVPEIILRCVSRDEAALAVAQKVFKGLYENASNSFHVNACLAILAAIRDVCKLVVKELTSWVIYSDEERKFNKDITLGLISSELLNLAEYNVHMAKLIDGGRNKAATDFAISLVQALVVEESNVISELHNLVDALAKLAAKSGSAESLQQLIEIVRNPGANVASLTSLTLGKEDKARQSRDKKPSSQLIANREDYGNIESVEPEGFREQVSVFFAEWYRICELPGANDAASTQYIFQLHRNGLLKGDEMTDRFFCVLTELSVAHCLSSEVINSSALQSPQQVQSLSFLAIDIYAKLVVSILKVEQGSSKLFLLSKILSVTMKLVQKDSEERKNSFNARPYFRLFISWLQDLLSPEPVIDGVNFQILTAFAGVFHNLQPLKVPGFSYVWLSLVSHRSFMPRLLTGNAQKGWPYVQRLLVDLFQFLEPYLRNAELSVPVHLLYKGTLRVLLVLLHDFPEFLCDYHFTFCDVIPPSCIQMRNIILSAFPLNMRLPDPSTPNLKIDLLPEIMEPPRIFSEVDAALKAKQMKADVDEYLKTRQQGSSFLTELKQRLLLIPSEAVSAGTRYNVPLINSLVLYAGMQAIQQLQARTPHGQSAGNTVSLAVFLVDAALDIYQTLILDLDTEGRYLFLNAVANQLRYPNNHTHYFSFVLLYLFAESNQEIIQEQITRVLLERLIVNRPHPWGLLITFIELIKNPRYNFWNRSFIRCAPEIEKLFESVARSCGGLKPMDDSMVSSWVSESAH